MYLKTLYDMKQTQTHAQDLINKTTKDLSSVHAKQKRQQQQA